MRFLDAGLAELEIMYKAVPYMDRAALNSWTEWTSGNFNPADPYAIRSWESYLREKGAL